MKLYDYGYKDLFSHREIIWDLIHHFFKEDWFEGIEIESLEKVNSHYIDKKYLKREGDIVWKMQYKGECFYLYLLLEFQSRVDRYMSIRLMSYIGLLYEDLIKSKVIGKSGCIPPVLPWVIYTGKSSWSAPIHSGKLLEEGVPKGLKAYFPQFKYQLLDMGRYPIEQNFEKTNSFIATLIKLEQIGLDNDQVVSTVERLMVLLRGSEHNNLRRSCAMYLSQTLNLKSVEPMYDIQNGNLEEKPMLGDRIRAHHRKLIKEGEKNGMQKGIQKGKQQVAIEMLRAGLDINTISKVTHLPAKLLESMV